MNSIGYFDLPLDERASSIDSLSKKRSKGMFPLVLIAVPALLAAHTIFGNPEFLLRSHIASMLLGLLTIFSWYAYLRGNASEKRAPILEVYVAYQYSLYGLSTFFPVVPVTNREVYPRMESYADASTMAFVSTLFFVVGFHAASRPFRQIKLQRLLPPITLQQLDRAAWPYLIATAAVAVMIRYQALGVLTGAASIIFAQATNFAIQFALFLELPKRSSTVRFAAAILLQVALFFFHSSFEDIAQIFFIIVLGYVWLRKRFRFGLLGVGVAAYMVLQPLKGHYREYAWRGDVAAGETQDQGSAFDAWEYAYDQVSHQTKDERQVSQRSAISRLSELPTLAFTVEAVPSLVPYQGYSSTLEAILIGTIPRVVWPNKPSMTAIAGSQFTQVVGITTWEQDQYTATSFPLVSHGYAISGVAGVMFWSAALGMLARFYASILAATIYRIVLGIAFSMAFARILTLVSPFACIWQQIVGWLAFAWFVLLVSKLRRNIVS